MLSEAFLQNETPVLQTTMTKSCPERPLNNVQMLVRKKIHFRADRLIMTGMEPLVTSVGRPLVMLDWRQSKDLTSIKWVSCYATYFRNSFEYWILYTIMPGFSTRAAIFWRHTSECDAILEWKQPTLYFKNCSNRGSDSHNFWYYF